MPTALLATLYFVCPYIIGIDGSSIKAKFILLAFVFAYTFFFPSLMVLWLYKRKSIESITLEKLSDRRFPFLFSIISSGFLSYFLYQKGPQLQGTAIVIGFIAVTIFIIALVSLKWQISAHAAGIGGLIGAFFMLKFKYDEMSLNTPFFLAIIVAGLVLSSRLKLNAHTLLQVIAGLLVGIIVSSIGSIFI
ncbi:hypothetical protein [uncultured Arcticibacterium sp.]|uniref:phosphatase PAP2 family protein n=1 Tax=uncultured Arcticibacterium sp. TaxID=2173042 RepID=UPI0030FB7A23